MYRLDDHDHDHDLGVVVGAGDRDRTGMTSLEGRPHCTVIGADLCIWVAGGDRY
jgi:hypothetical protein